MKKLLVMGLVLAAMLVGCGKTIDDPDDPNGSRPILGGASGNPDYSMSYNVSDGYFHHIIIGTTGGEEPHEFDENGICVKCKYDKRTSYHREFESDGVDYYVYCSSVKQVVIYKDVNGFVYRVCLDMGISDIHDEDDLYGDADILKEYIDSKQYAEAVEYIDTYLAPEKSGRKRYVLVSVPIDKTDDVADTDIYPYTISAWSSYEYVDYYPPYTILDWKDEYQYYCEHPEISFRLYFFYDWEDRHISSEFESLVDENGEFVPTKPIDLPQYLDFMVGTKSADLSDYDKYYVVVDSDNSVIMYHSKIEYEHDDGFYDEIEILTGTITDRLKRMLAKEAYLADRADRGHFFSSDYVDAVLRFVEETDVTYPHTVEVEGTEITFANWYEEYEWNIETNK